MLRFGQSSNVALAGGLVALATLSVCSGSSAIADTGSDRAAPAEAVAAQDEQARSRAPMPWNNGTTWNFETGDLRGWGRTGNAFQFQPTRGDNPTARRRGQPSQHVGNYWIGTYEKYRGRRGERAGAVQGDGPRGMLTSKPFTVPGGNLTFLVGGGSSNQTRVELLVGNRSVLSVSGRNTETMRRVTWNLAPWRGRQGRIRIVDNASGGWGHINADDFRFQRSPTPPAGRRTILKPVADTHVYAYAYRNWNRQNWGKWTALGAGWHPTGGEKRTFIRFRLAGYNLSVMKSAKLRLYHYHSAGSGQVPLGVYRITQRWNEGRGMYNPASPARPGESTWINQPRYAPAPIATFRPGPRAGKWVEVDITNLIRQWGRGVPNYGLAIATTTRPNRSVRESQYGFVSREHQNSARHPQLVLER